MPHDLQAEPASGAEGWGKGRTPTAALALADGTVVLGVGCGATGTAVGELCFNTAMTGYQEILTDPSYAQQVVLFTFPHIGNVGTNPLDEEHSSPAARRAAVGTVLRAPVTPPSNWRAEDHFDAWLARRGIVGISGVDTRALTHRIREGGMPKCAVQHAPDGALDLAALVATAQAWAGLEGADLALDVGSDVSFAHTDGLWQADDSFAGPDVARFHVVLIDYGVKANILRNLAAIGARVSVVPALTSAEAILALNPDGVVLSNGPGDPAATGVHAGPVIRALVDSGLPVLGICLGHQMLALAMGARTEKMAQGHHGANHPVKDLTTGKVAIVSMNHGFTVARDSLPEGVEETHVSLFDGTNCGIALTGRPVFSVQHHPEASPGPQDSFYLFERFEGHMAAARGM
jgi:carbamoyl-phosphate synthase small subunit